MISKNKIKQIKSLSQKKYRSKNKLFLVEGNKMVTEVIQSNIEIVFLAATKEFISELNLESVEINEIQTVSQEELNKASLLQNPQQALAVCKIPEQFFSVEKLKGSLTIGLDTIQDPGNLGTIIRIADWYGIDTIVASHETVDVFNPKVIQATMGAFCRVRVIYADLKELLTTPEINDVQVYGTFMEGKNIYTQNLPSKGLVIMGNEGQGISKELMPYVQNKLHIPGYQTSESLNVAVATAIICSEFKREGLKSC